MEAKNNISPLPLFDSIEQIKEQKVPKYLKHVAKKDYFIRSRLSAALRPG